MTAHMARALDLARRALGNVSPNPAVGAVVVRDGRIVGEGHTSPPGGDHAEVAALNQAGNLAEGAALYSTLEPHQFHGRTPPCTDAIIRAGIAHVHFAVTDPNPGVDGRGAEALRNAGVAVTAGEMEAEATEQIEAYAMHVTQGRPFVIAKYAMSADGKIAARSGDARWVTGTVARAHVHELRAQCDAIMVGIGTVLADDPRLTARDSDGCSLKRQPLRVVVDSAGQTPASASLLREPGHTVVATASPPSGTRELLAAAGAELLCQPGPGGRVDLDALLDVLGKRDVTSVLVEGGGTLMGTLFDMGLVDKVLAFVAPKIIGGVSAPGPVGGRGAAKMAQAIELKRLRWQSAGDDMLLTGYCR